VIIFKKRLEAENAVRASFVATEEIVKHSKSYSEGEFMKSCLVAAVDILYPNNSNDMYTICLSRLTVTRRIAELAVD
jgi:hypothetical protein